MTTEEEYTARIAQAIERAYQRIANQGQSGEEWSPEYLTIF